MKVVQFMQNFVLTFHAHTFVWVRRIVCVSIFTSSYEE